MWYAIFIVVGGTYLTAFGARILFQKGFVETLRQNLWRSDNEEWFGKHGYIFDKYGRGLRYFLSGIVLTILGLLVLIKDLDFT